MADSTPDLGRYAAVLRGKGDHRHLGEREEDYNFISLERLLADFEHDVNEWGTS
jgi:hypothetical protein